MFGCCKSSLEKGVFTFGSTYVVGSLATLVALSASSGEILLSNDYCYQNRGNSNSTYHCYDGDKDIMYFMTAVSFLQFLASLLLIFGTTMDETKAVFSWLLSYTMTVTVFALVYTGIAILCFLTTWTTIGRWILGGSVVDVALLIYCIILLECQNRRVNRSAGASSERNPSPIFITPR